MTEQNRGEGEPKTESLEEQKYKALLAAQEEVGRLMKEMDRILEAAGDRVEAEKNILRDLAPQMDVAIKAEGEAFRAWQKVTEEDQAAYKRDMAAHEEEMGK